MTATTDEAGLLRAILAQPFEDTPRLALADELEANGDRVRAEFIRVECRVATPPWTSKDMIRGAELWLKIKEEYRSSLPKLPDGSRWTIHAATPSETGSNTAIVRRGFVDEIRCDLATLLGGTCDRCGGLKRGDRVEPAGPGNALACGSGLYSQAVVVSLNPFALVSEAGDMLWTATQSPQTVRRAGANPAAPLAAYRRWDVAKKDYQKRGDGDDCPACNGTGHTPGVARELFLAHPVTRINIGQRAIRSDRGPGFKCWSLVTHIDLTKIPELDGIWVWYETECDALDTLNARLVAVCRGRAGLPPLPGGVA
jgi:uncharacterized protein (TIGR02996 family)